jgi:hypothetical protein
MLRRLDARRRIAITVLRSGLFLVQLRDGVLRGGCESMQASVIDVVDRKRGG